jgi:hypothetical protein
MILLQSSEGTRVGKRRRGGLLFVLALPFDVRGPILVAPAVDPFLVAPVVLVGFGAFAVERLDYFFSLGPSLSSLTHDRPRDRSGGLPFRHLPSKVQTAHHCHHG